MEETSSNKKPKLLISIVTVVIAVVIMSVILYGLYARTHVAFQLSDPSNDVVLSLGTQYPSIVDVLSASLAVNGTMLNITIDVGESIDGLAIAEIAQWNVTMILENETAVLKTYEIVVNMKLNRLTGSIIDVKTQNMLSCQVSHQASSLKVLAAIDELSSAKVIEWSILTTYEQYSGTELTTSASDLAPDEGLQKTILLS